MSSLIYHQARACVGLREPTWTSDGELLNNDRFAMYGGLTDDSGVKFIARTRSAQQFDRTLEFLDHVVQRRGFAYKDVVNPFVISTWLQDKDVCALRIERDIAEVALAMSQRRWLYPTAGSSATGSDAALVAGLLQADAALRTVPATTVRYDELIHDEAPLHRALVELYPGHPVRARRYIDTAFVAQRARILERRRTDRYEMLCEEVRRLS
jgi:hypothetical protein